jgi:hypothetical protein
MNRETPEAVLARRLNLLQGVTGLDASNTFYGTGGRFPSYRAPNININPGGWTDPNQNIGDEPFLNPSPSSGGRKPRFNYVPEGAYPGLDPMREWNNPNNFTTGADGGGWLGDMRTPDNWNDIGTGDQAAYAAEAWKNRGLNPADYE